MNLSISVHKFYYVSKYFIDIQQFIITAGQLGEVRKLRRYFIQSLYLVNDKLVSCLYNGFEIIGAMRISIEHVLHRKLHGGQRILDLVCYLPCNITPCSLSLSLLQL